jgi:hypothetical protein
MAYLRQGRGHVRILKGLCVPSLQFVVYAIWIVSVISTCPGLIEVETAASGAPPIDIRTLGTISYAMGYTGLELSAM